MGVLNPGNKDAQLLKASTFWLHSESILGMYFIERRGPDHQWIRELNFKTEFKALIGARRKAISTLATYRIVHAMWPNQAVCYVDGPELANEVETKG